MVLVITLGEGNEKNDHNKKYNVRLSIHKCYDYCISACDSVMLLISLPTYFSLLAKKTLQFHQNRRIPPESVPQREHMFVCKSTSYTLFDAGMANGSNEINDHVTLTHIS